MKSWKTAIGINGFIWQTIGTNGFEMVFGPATIDADGFEVRQPLDTMVFQCFPMVANHWSNGGLVTIHHYGLSR